MDWIVELTHATSAQRGEVVQSLWSGYGEIVRVGLTGADLPSVILKEVRPPGGSGLGGGGHPRGWNTDRSHQRKLRSYAVEMAFYERWSARCGEGCRVPRWIGGGADEEGWRFVLEDLDDAGFGGRRSGVSDPELRACLRWLAEFHATFLGEKPDGLWDVGTYWHLDTRPDELATMPDDDPLKSAAAAIDAKLNAARFQTFVHGDTKVANFCFSESDPGAVAAVDFQYIGGGCGMKDVAYFLGSCLSERECEAREEELLATYFGHLRDALGDRWPGDELESEWRDLYPVAWTDFHRFLLGWSPGHWKINSYSERVTAQVLESLARDEV